MFDSLYLLVLYLILLLEFTWLIDISLILYMQIFNKYYQKPNIDGCDLLKFVKFFVIIRSFKLHQSLRTGPQVWFLQILPKKKIKIKIVTDPDYICTGCILSRLMQEHLSPKQRRPNSLFCLACSYHKISLLFLYVMFYLWLCL